MLQEGERYECPDANCGCAIQVIKAAAPGKGGNQAPALLLREGNAENRLK
jgi:hypothetical protein